MVTQEADEGRSLDESGGGNGAAQAVHDRIAVGGPRSTGWATVAVSAGPLEASPTPLLVVQVSPLGGGEVAIVSRCVEALAVR